MSPGLGAHYVPPQLASVTSHTMSLPTSRSSHKVFLPPGKYFAPPPFFFFNFKNFYFTSFQHTGRRLDICIVCETTPPGLFLASDSPPGRPVTADRVPQVPRAVRPGPATVRQRLPRAALTLPPVLRPRDPLSGRHRRSSVSASLFLISFLLLLLLFLDSALSEITWYLSSSVCLTNFARPKSLEGHPVLP